jgi:hypothetical protein
MQVLSTYNPPALPALYVERHTSIDPRSPSRRPQQSLRAVQTHGSGQQDAGRTTAGDASRPADLLQKRQVVASWCNLGDRFRGAEPDAAIRQRVLTHGELDIVLEAIVAERQILALSVAADQSRCCGAGGLH